MSLCETCAKFLGHAPAKIISDEVHQPPADRIDSNTSDSNGTQSTNKQSADFTCSVCLGVWSSAFSTLLQAAIAQAVQPYAQGPLPNRFSRRQTPPIVVLPGDLVHRYRVAAARPPQLSSSAVSPVTSTESVTHFGQRLKQHAKTVLLECLDHLEHNQPAGGIDDDVSACSPKAPKWSDYPASMEEEELGYLAVHVIVLPRAGVGRPVRPVPKAPQRASRHKRSNNNNNNNNNSNDNSNDNLMEEHSQGGDPRVNLEQKLERQGLKLWPINQAMEGQANNSHSKNDWKELKPLQLTSASNDQLLGLDIYIAVWRRPFYLQSYYTKTRRDVSQTPFYVVDGGKRRKLGVTSVEEQITPAVIRHCGGISQLNNSNNHCDNNTVFGMAKFHASGREDMDVRMLLPDEEDCKIAAQQGARITGRPFVYEIYDAFQLPTLDSLLSLANEVNHLDSSHNNKPEPRAYGCNPMGVGIAPEVKFVPSAAFKQLQAETEEKIKHYGCLCWSRRPLPPTAAALTAHLESQPWPLELRQRTPIRVLHRRANSVRIRHVVTCRLVQRVDDHYFRLHLSTTAGTYVKEFCHGDLGRTVPNLASVLQNATHNGGNGSSTIENNDTDILELDCEGIQL